MTYKYKYYAALQMITFCLLLTVINANGQTNEHSTYDKKLADSLSADEYGMKMYYLVILKSGANKIEDKTITDSLFRGHMQNIIQMVKLGKLVVAGPLQENEKNYEGIFILNVKTAEEAKALLENDPAIKSHVLDTEFYEWYGSAALPLYLPYHDKIQKTHF